MNFAGIQIDGREEITTEDRRPKANSLFVKEALCYIRSARRWNIVTQIFWIVIEDTIGNPILFSYFCRYLYFILGPRPSDCSLSICRYSVTFYRMLKKN